MKLDLHGKSHHDVFREVDKFIWSCMKKNLSEFQIITGNSERMKSIVISRT
jgi:DNA-nicking Smr family endonuclease